MLKGQSPPPALLKNSLTVKPTFVVYVGEGHPWMLGMGMFSVLSTSLKPSSSVSERSEIRTVFCEQGRI